MFSSIGGWLVLESFLSPEMFVNASTTVPYGSNPPTYGVTGEYQLCADAAQQDAADGTHKLAVAARLRQAFATHRDNFVTQSDFQLMASVGINAVRIPVGYWLLAQTAVRCPTRLFGRLCTRISVVPLMTDEPALIADGLDICQPTVELPMPSLTLCCGRTSSVRMC